MASAAAAAPDHALLPPAEQPPPPHNGPAEDDNKFQKAIASWRGIDLTNLVPQLDAAAADLAAQQRDALVDRKDLAEKTKVFRRLDDPAKLTEIKGLLKAYQTYIDLVSAQNKTASSAFFSVYSPLSEAPDPYPLLEASVDSLVVADHTVPRLEAENKRLKSSKEKLTAQLEDLERQLHDERQARAAVEHNRETKIKEVEASWSAVLTEKQNNWEAREKSLEERAENQERLLKELKASYEVNARLDKDAHEASAPTASAAEVDMLTSDLERATTRLAEVQARNEQLRLQVAQAASHAGGPQRPVEDDPAYLRLRSENQSLLRKMDAAKLERDAEKRELDETTRSANRDLLSLKADNESLRSKITAWSDYDEVKKELEILKSIEFSTGDADDVVPESAAASGSEDQSQKLERLLMSRNKKLNDDLTLLRVAHQETTHRLESLQDELSSTNMELEKSRNLTAQLEGDLERLQQEAASIHPAMSVAGTYTSRYPATRKGGGRVSPTSSIISGFDNADMRGSGGGADGAASGILPMVTAQRDRFKKRITELETELSKNYQTVQSLRSEVSGLQKDNLNLYEKTRYVSSFQRGQPAASGSALSHSPNPSTIAMGDPTADRYQPAYEARLSPFAQFRGRESARALKRMSLPERVVFQITRMVLATRSSRNLFALYCLCLHLLVLGMLYFVTSETIDHTVISSVAAQAVAADAPGGLDADDGAT